MINDFIVDESCRLDSFLTRSLNLSGESVTRSQVSGWIKLGNVDVNGVEVCKAGFLVVSGDRVRLTRVAPVARVAVEHLDLEKLLSVVYYDDHIVVVNKSAGLVVHHGAGTFGQITLVDLLEPLGFKTAVGESGRPGIVHRLDRDTSGVMVIAKTALAHAHLSAAFAERKVAKEYLGLVHETPRRRTIFGVNQTGIIDAPITRDVHKRIKMTVGEGRSAWTEWEVIDRYQHAIFLRLRPRTGRTHQIRVHCSSVGAPLLGDKLYSDGGTRSGFVLNLEEQLGRHALHAHKLTFPHPVSGEMVSFECVEPFDFELCRKSLKEEGRGF
jgi:23S rRNA pseudouridine1911/1915/1917 synthase